MAHYSFLTARELVSKSRDGASFKKSTRKSRGIKRNIMSTNISEKKNWNSCASLFQFPVCFHEFLAISYFISFHSTIILATFVQIVTFVELPGSCHPTKQILTQIVVFVIFILFAVKLPPYYRSCDCTRPFFVIFAKIVLFDVFAVKLAPYNLSSHFTA